MIISLINSTYVLQYLENVLGYLWNPMFIWRRIFALFPSFVIILVCDWDALGTKSVILIVHWAIRRNFEIIEL